MENESRVISDEMRRFNQNMANDYVNGMTHSQIIAKYDPICMGLFCQRVNRTKVSMAIQAWCDPEYLKQRAGEDRRKALELKEQGKTVAEIAQILDLGKSKTNEYVHAEQHIKRAVKKVEDYVKPADIEYLKQNVHPGDSIKMQVRKYYYNDAGRQCCNLINGWVRILSCHKNIVLTSQGCMSWGEMAGYIKGAEA